MNEVKFSARLRPHVRYYSPLQARYYSSKRRARLMSHVPAWSCLTETSDRETWETSFSLNETSCSSGRSCWPLALSTKGTSTTGTEPGRSGCPPNHLAVTCRKVPRFCRKLAATRAVTLYRTRSQIDGDLDGDVVQLGDVQDRTSCPLRGDILSSPLPVP